MPADLDAPLPEEARRVPVKKLFGLLALVAVSHLLGIGVGFMASNGFSREAPAKPNFNVTLNNFRLIQDGMAFGEVQDKMGDRGQLVSGVAQGDDGDFTVVWRNGEAAIEVEFRQGKVAQKFADHLQ